MDPLQLKRKTWSFSDATNDCGGAPHSWAAEKQYEINKPV
jgi:hypothetical protein